MPNISVRVKKNDGEYETFSGICDSDSMTASTNSHGDLTICRYNKGDPYQVNHVVVIFAAGKWERIDQGVEQR